MSFEKFLHNTQHHQKRFSTEIPTFSHPKILTITHKKISKKSNHISVSIFPHLFVASLRIRMPPFHMSTQTIKDALAPRETNGQVVFLKKLHWFKMESQVEAYVDKIIRPRQVEYYWPEKDGTAKKAKKENMGYVWIVCENEYAAKTLVKEINLEETKRGFYGRTLEAVHMNRRPVNVQSFSDLVCFNSRHH